MSIDALHGRRRRRPRDEGIATAASPTRRRRHSAIGAHPLPRSMSRQLRRLQGAERPDPDRRRRRVALRHRAQRRRQDDDDGRDHRQDAPRRRHRVLRPDDRSHATVRARDRGSPASAASSRSRRCSPITRCSRTSSSPGRPTSACGRRCRAKLDSAARDRIAAILDTIKLAPDADRLAGLLSHGQKQWLEIGMLLMQEPQLLCSTSRSPA